MLVSLFRLSWRKFKDPLATAARIHGKGSGTTRILNSWKPSGAEGPANLRLLMVFACKR